MKYTKRILAILMSMCMTFLLYTSVFAADTSTTIKNVGDGVLQIRLYYVTNAGEEIPIQQGTCFLINEKTVLTNLSVVSLTEGQIDELEATYSVDLSTATARSRSFTYRVVVRRDVTIEATLQESLQSPTIDFAVLNLAQQIYDRTPLPLGNSDQVNETDSVYSLGYPMISSMVQDTSKFTKEDVDIQTGIINKKLESNGVPLFQHSATAADNMGGPVVNTSGIVIGMNRGIDALTDLAATVDNVDNYNYAVQINEIKEYLDSFGVAYTSAEDMGTADTGAAGETDLSLVVPPADSTADNNDADQQETETETTTEASAEETEPPTEPVLEPDLTEFRDSLSNTLEEAEKIDQATLTDESANILQKAMDSAEEALDASDATQASLEDAEAALREAINGAEEKPDNTPMILAIGIGGGVIVLIIIVIIVLATRKKPAAATAAPQPSIPPSAASTGGGQAYSGNNNAARNYDIPTAPGTEVLGSGAGATDILGGTQNTYDAYLIRQKTQEKTVINTANFAIGKERGKVNYCIADNTTVSRVHAVIQKRGAEYYITDQKSTNYTYVNGVRLTPGQEKQLNNGDSIKLSDEVFEFVRK